MSEWPPNTSDPVTDITAAIAANQGAEYEQRRRQQAAAFHRERANALRRADPQRALMHAKLARAYDASGGDR